MTPINLLCHLQRLDVSLWVEDDNLHYNAPAGTISPSLRAQIVEHKWELINILKSANQAKAGTPVPQRQRPYPIPLSFAQQRLWFLNQLEPESTAYHSPMSFRLRGQLNVQALKDSLQVVIDRQESLRTSFPVKEGQATQAITSQMTVAWQYEDLQHLSNAERNHTTHMLISENINRPFNLSAGPLLRTLLLQLGNEEYIWVLTLHHIVTDGWSMGILSREIGTTYKAQLQHSTPILPLLSIQYADYAVWQRARLQGDLLETQLEYWRQELNEVSPLALPTDFVRPPVQTFAAAVEKLKLPPHLQQALHVLSRKHGATLGITLLAAFNVLLAKYTGQTDLVVGSPIANRTRREIEGLIGFFVNTLVLRTNIVGNPSFTQLLEQVRKTSLGAYDNQEIPFERIVEELQPERDPSRNPFFQVIFAVQNVQYDGLHLWGLTTEPYQHSEVTTRVDLECHVWEDGNELTVKLIYNTCLFALSTMRCLGKHFQVLLEKVIRDPAQRVSDISLLDDADHQLLESWNRTTTAYPRERTIAELFETQVVERPDALAVVAGDEQVSYGQLNALATQLAQYLRRQGVRLGGRVGVCLERGLDVPICLLAVLKVGAAYVPLDPQAPPGRLQYVIQDAALDLILTDIVHRERVAATSMPRLVLDEIRDTLRHESCAALAGLPTSAQLAYLMYTSGSTGQSKGTLISHRNVVRLVREQTYAKLDAEQRLLGFAPLAFDASTFEIWGSLLNGAALILAPSGLLSMTDLGQLLETEAITTVWLTAGLFHQLVKEEREKLSHVVQVLAGGEVLSTDSVGQLLGQRESGVVINGYGPTENTTFACCHAMTHADQVGASVPIGRPIANTQVYVVDRGQQLVPVGVAGELLIGGDGLAWGYLNQPGVTAEKFVPHPFSQAPGARVYRSGDQVRWRAEGMLEFLGRQDRQIKLRGYRIELEEIEAALQHHPEIREAVVVCREEPPGEKQLVAYVVPSAESVTSGELRTALQRRLPPYMVPAVFVLLPQLPLTPNGKVDLRALPQPDAGDRMPGVSYVAPRTDLERQLAHIWQEVLKLERVGIHDNFFELGGHSLLATQLIWRISEHFAIKLPIQQLFEQPTIAELSSTVKFVLDSTNANTASSSYEGEEYLEVSL